MENLASFASQAAACQAMPGCNTWHHPPLPLSIIEQDIEGLFLAVLLK